MFRKLLIANRGEIACRVIKTARRLGIVTVAVYSDADAMALHVNLADEAFPLGPAPARDSYLVIDKLLEIARRSGAEAIHPGYGFLAENADFSQRCTEKGFVFVGPPAEAMRLLGSKAAAKTLMQRAGVPVVPGYHGDANDMATTILAAERIGYPLLIKAVSGGGGRGMRIVGDSAELRPCIESARREAAASFGDENLLIEKYLTGHRHVETQIFADAHGGVVSFYERDCSMQRHHQKIIEETPTPHISASFRSKMRDAAVRVARAAFYVGAGTVEFLVKDESYYFLEMNARLQVEHPVTEMISGQDLVEWQLRVACGDKLPLMQDGLIMRGCALEARICAEDPTRGFLPSVGDIVHFRAPPESPFLRIDSGVREGDGVTPYYDSLIAKLIVWDVDRASALKRLQRALDAVELVGVMTNLDLLRALSRSAEFVHGDYDTQFVEANVLALIRAPAPSADNDIVLLAAASAHFISDRCRLDADVAQAAGDDWSPWAAADGWRVNGESAYDIAYKENGRKLSTRIHLESTGRFRLETGSAAILVEAAKNGDRMSLWLDGVKRELSLVPIAGGVVVILAGRNYILQRIEKTAATQLERGPDRRLIAPIPARVTRVLTRVDEPVVKGAPLVVLEAMKMEITLSAPRDGVVESVGCVEGDMTMEGAELVALREVETS
jgi:3-methylcrotonyl-CoA carboxylase alpha subunit